MHKLQFIGSETLAMLRDWREVRNVATGVIFTLPATDPVPIFNDYFFGLSIENNRRNPWFPKFFQFAANCTISGNSTALQLCNRTETLRDTNYLAQIEVFNPISFVIDSVYTFAHALRISIERACGKFRGGDPADCVVPGNEFLQILRNGTFESSTGNKVDISDTGDVIGGYRIYYLYKGLNGNFENVQFGE